MFSRRSSFKSTDGDYQPEYIGLASWPELQTTHAAITLLRPKQPLDARRMKLRRAEATAVARYLWQQVNDGACEWSDVGVAVPELHGRRGIWRRSQEQGVPFRIIAEKATINGRNPDAVIALVVPRQSRGQTHLVGNASLPLFGWADELVFLTSRRRAGTIWPRQRGTQPKQVKQTFATPARVAARAGMILQSRVTRTVFARTRFAKRFRGGQPAGRNVSPIY